MRIVNVDGQVNIYLTPEEVRLFCRPGQGADTCIWLMVGPDGFECCYFSQPTALLDRWAKGQTVAKRSGCDKVKSLPYQIKTVEAQTLEEIINEGKPDG